MTVLGNGFRFHRQLVQACPDSRGVCLRTPTWPGAGPGRLKSCDIVRCLDWMTKLDWTYRHTKRWWLCGYGMLWNLMDDKAQKLSLICHFSHLSQEMWQTTFLLAASVWEFCSDGSLAWFASLQDVEPHLCKWEWHWPYWCNRSQGISAAAFGTLTSRL